VVCRSVTIVSPIKTAAPMPFGLWTPVDPRKDVLDVDAHRRNLANTSEPFMCGSDAFETLRD